MRKIVKKKYYRIPFELTSPLSVGSGENQVTDKDIARNSKGDPYIPGSALAGLYRNYLDETGAETARYFGDLIKARSESKVIVYDARILEGSPYVTKRDMVALDDYKVAIPGAKFDFQILEPGVQFVTFLEQDIEDGDDEAILDRVITWLISGEAALGSKVMRGYGHIQANKEGIKYAKFRMPRQNKNSKNGMCQQEENDLDAWLKFDVFNPNDENWKQWEPSTGAAENNPKSADTLTGSPNRLTIKLSLAQKGGLSVRQYSTKPGEADYMQMRLRGGAGLPVIPGTSWAGAFRAQMKKLGMTEDELVSFFGKARKKTGFRSRISFTETPVEGGSDVVYSRNAIDRFTGGTVDGALYTESTHYNGKTELTICVNFPTESEENLKNSNDKDPSEGKRMRANEKFKRVLAAAIVDLNEGYLAVGGLTSVGRGLFSVEKVTVNGKSILLQGKDAENESEQPQKTQDKDGGYQRILTLLMGKAEAELKEMDAATGGAGNEQQ